MKLFHRIADLGSGNKSTIVYWNSIVGMATNIVQSLFFSIYFIILARFFGPQQFSQYVVANSLYQLVAIIAPFGLLSYFVREYSQNEGMRLQLSREFVVIEFSLSFLGYLSIILLAFALNYETTIVTLAIILGINLLFDNILYFMKGVFVAESKQFYFGVGILVESFLKAILGCVLLIVRLSLVDLVCIAVMLRIITFVVAYRLLRFTTLWQSTKLLSPLQLLKDIKISHAWSFLKKANNFAVIGTLSVLYWRLNVVILSKFGEANQVAYYEIGARLFSVVQLVPVAYLLSLYPIVARAFQENKDEFIVLTRKALRHVVIFSLAVAVPFSVAAPDLTTLLFGAQYSPAGVIGAMMFWTLIPFSIGLLQAYLLLASGNERIDMWLNALSLSVNVGVALVLIPSMQGMGVAISIFVSFCIFVITQHFILQRKGIHVWKGLIMRAIVLAGCAVLPVFVFSTLNKYVGMLIGQTLLWLFVIRWRMFNLTILKQLFQKRTPAANVEGIP
jgi:O-antigen/teichoic acid export membrane protein